MVSQSIKSLYKALAALLLNYRKSAFGSQHINQTLAYAEQLIESFHQAPDPLTAQLQLPQKQMPGVLNLAFSASLHTLQLCARNNFNDTCSQQLISAAISLLATDQQEITHYLNGNTSEFAPAVDKRLMLALNKTRQQLWANGHKIQAQAGRLQWHSRNWPVTYNREQQLLFMALSLALLTTGNQRVKRRSYANALRELARACPSRWLPLLEPLASYPGLVPPGSILCQPGSEHQLVLSLSEQHQLLVPLDKQGRAGEPAWHPITAGNKVQTTSLAGFSRLDNWWNDDWQHALTGFTDDHEHEQVLAPVSPTFRIDRPPATLLEIQQRLQQEDIEARELAQLIEQEPLLARYVLDTARQSSRQNIVQSSVRQGLMMHGFERTGSMLMQYALLQRINQHSFPLQEALLQFTLLRGELASQLAERHGKFVGEQLRTLAVFASAGLFTLPALKTQQQWSLREDNWFNLDNLLLHPQSQLLTKHCVRLAESWQQPARFVSSIRNHHRMPQQHSGNKQVAQLAALLGLSLIAARSLYFTAPMRCENTEGYLNQALIMLNIPHPEYQQLLDGIGHWNSVYCPYPGK